MSARKVLLVDDEAPVRAVCRRALAGLVSGIDEAASLAEARRLLGSESYGLLVTDVRLGDGSGWEAARLFRERFPGAPVVVITGSPDESMERRLEALPGAILISKPFDLGELRRAVSRGLGEAGA